MPKYDIPKIKMHLRLLARALRESKEAFKKAQREGRDPWGLEPSDEIVAAFEAEFIDAPGRCGEHGIRQFRSKHGGWWMWGSVSLYFTRLCCLRATMRGRSHFAENTRSETLNYLGVEALTLEAQTEWAEEIADRYELEEDEDAAVRAAG